MPYSVGLPPSPSESSEEPSMAGPARSGRRMWIGATVAATLVASAVGAVALFGDRGGEGMLHPVRDTESRDVSLNAPFTKSISAPHEFVSGYSYRSTDGARTVLLVAQTTALRTDLADESSPGDAVLREAWRHMPGRFDRIVVAESDGSGDSTSMRVMASGTYRELRERFGVRGEALERRPSVRISASPATRTRAGRCGVPETGVRSEACTQPPTSLPAATTLKATRSWCGLDDGALDIAVITQSTQNAVPDPEGHVTFVLVGRRADRMIHIPLTIRPGSKDSDGVLLVCGGSAHQMSPGDFLAAGRSAPEEPPSTEPSDSFEVPGGDGDSFPWDWDEEAPTATDMEALGSEWTRHASAEECRTSLAAVATLERLKEFANNGDETIRTWSEQYSAEDFTALVAMGRFVRALQADGHDDPPGTVAAHIPDICAVFAGSDPGQ
ncbi:hypothetical protein [Streptomyces sp. SAI-229]|uniref:hypothetical protein n=1 Tax=Streptomyces sp. SAI-229 TaxID=3377731 RepID=UPI003C7AE2E9